MKHAYLLDIELVQECFLLKKLKELRAYQLLRITASDSGGHIALNSYDKSQISKTLNISAYQVTKVLKNLKELNWIYQNGKKWIVKSITRVRAQMNITRKTCIVFDPTKDFQQTFKKWKSFLMSAFRTYKIKFYNKWKRRKIRSSAINVDDNTGQYAHSLVMNELSLSKGEVSKLHKTSVEEGFCTSSINFDPNYGLIFLKDVNNFKKAHPEIAYKVNIGLFKGKKYGYVRTANRLTSVLCLKKRNSKPLLINVSEPRKLVPTHL